MLYGMFLGIKSGSSWVTGSLDATSNGYNLLTGQLIYWYNGFWLCIFRGSSLVYNTSARHEWHECETSATLTIRVQHEWKVSILITTLVKTYFYTPILTIWQVKDYEERNNFILRTNFWKCLVPMPKCVWKVHHKNWTF